MHGGVFIIQDTKILKHTIFNSCIWNIWVMSLKNQNLQNIQKQIELYFSDANLRHDKYMLNILQTSEQGNIPISKILSFNKIISLKVWTITF